MKRRHRSSDEAEIDMTPMLDVTFIMLIFFIVTTSFVKVSGIDVSRPSSAPAKVQKQNAKPIVIQLKPDGTVLVNNQKIAVEAIQDSVQRFLAVDAKATVIVVASGRANAGLMVTAIDQARAAGAQKVSIATTKGSG